MSTDTPAPLDPANEKAEQVWISKKYGTKHTVVGWSDRWDMWEMRGPHGTYQVHGWDLRARYDLETTP